MGAAIIPLIASLASTVIGAMMKKDPEPAAQAPQPAKPAEAETKATEPETVLDTEAAKARAIKRRQDRQVSGGSLLGLQEAKGSTTQKTLLGE